MKTKRVLSLWKIKSKAKRRALILVSFPVFFVGNLILSWAAWTAAVCLLWWANQKELFRSAAHYWHTDERIEDGPNVKSQATDAALSRQVACTDGLCGNGSEVGAGGTAVDIAQAPDIHAELTMAAFHREVGK